MTNYVFHPNLILRTPNEHFSTDITEEQVGEYIAQKESFLEAVYLASPVLHTASLQWINSDDGKKSKVPIAIAKYIIRNRTRSTPFGLFSGVGVVEWGTQSDIKLAKGFNRHTRLDMNFLCSVAQKINQNPIIQANTLFRPNSSFYVIGEDIRYVEYAYIGTERMHQISSIKTNEFVELVLKCAAKGATIENIIKEIIADTISYQEAKSFVEELVSSQLIVNELEPTTTGQEFLKQILSVLQKVIIKTKDIFLTDLFTHLKHIDNEIDTLDDCKINSVDNYKNLILLIERLEVKFEENKLFQVDKTLLIEQHSRTIDSKFQEDIIRVSKKLNMLNEESINPNLSSFIKRFYDRYEDEEVPLLNVLDTETGIGYIADRSGDYTPLIEGIILPEATQPSNSLQWQAKQKKLFQRLQSATKNKEYEISFSSIGFEEQETRLNFCPSISIMFRVVNKERIFIESIGGSSAANLIGRFGHASNEIANILCDISNKEDSNNPDVIFAEIVHLPESRVGNILARPAFRKYEIPYLAKSSVADDSQIKLQDLYVSVRYNRVVLRHKETNKIIIPRLGTAHNYSHNALPVYQFLCDLQTQGFQPGVGFSWGSIGGEFTFLPRVVDDNVILSPATWQFSKKQINPLSQNFTIESFNDWKNKFNVPSSFVIAEGDNELYIDTSKALFVEVFEAAIKNKNSLILKEYLWEDTIPIKDAQGNTMANQLVATLIREKSIYNHKASRVKETSLQRTFSIGSEWLYLKLYCGAKSADLILEEGIAPLLKKAKARGWIDQWFFVRYNDPNYHLRIRFHLKDKKYLQRVVKLVDTYIKPFEQKSLIWKLQTDTYKRELERYGYEAIEPSELLFHYDSQMYLDFLDSIEGDERESIKWVWGIKSIDSLLTLAGLSLKGKKELLESLRNSFANEFKMDQALKSQLDKKYRESRGQIVNFLTKNVSTNNINEAYNNEISECLRQIESIINEKGVYIETLGSYIHMMVNRLISSGQRLHELLMYDFLHRYYTSVIAQSKNKS